MIARLSALGLCVCLASGALAETQYVTAASGARLVDGPWAESRSVGALAPGARVTVQERYQGYALVRAASGMRAWVSGGSIGARPPAKAAASAPVAAKPTALEPYSSVVWTKTGPLNMRSGPGTQHDITGQCQRGDWVKVVAKAGAWAQVTLADGKDGWVHTAYLTR